MSADSIIRSAAMSPCQTYRWWLTRSWGDAERRDDYVLFIGLNPSTADAQIDDPTVRRWTHFAQSWGYGGFVACNLYPFRSPDPAALKRWVMWKDHNPELPPTAAILHNLDVIRDQAASASLIVPCWGASAWDKLWVEIVVEAIFEATDLAEIHCLGTTADDAPMHPMARGKHRIPDDRQPILWRSL